MFEFISIIFWSFFLLFVILGIFGSVSKDVNGMMRRENRRQIKYYKNRNEDE